MIFQSFLLGFSMNGIVIEHVRLAATDKEKLKIQKKFD